MPCLQAWGGILPPRKDWEWCPGQVLAGRFPTRTAPDCPGSLGGERRKERTPSGCLLSEGLPTDPELACAVTGAPLQSGTGVGGVRRLDHLLLLDWGWGDARPGLCAVGRRVITCPTCSVIPLTTESLISLPSFHFSDFSFGCLLHYFQSSQLTSWRGSGAIQVCFLHC